MKPSLKDIATGLWCMAEMLLFFVSFCCLWLVAWALGMLALSLALLSARTWTIPPMSDGMGEILTLPKRYCLDRL